LQRTEEGRRYRALFGARLRDGSLFAGERPHHRVEVEPGCIVIQSGGVRSGRIGAGSIVVETMAGALRTRGRCIVYGVRAPGRLPPSAIPGQSVLEGTLRDSLGSPLRAARPECQTTGHLGKPTFERPGSIRETGENHGKRPQMAHGP
jgi:hypothetical protein